MTDTPPSPPSTTNRTAAILRGGLLLAVMAAIFFGIQALGTERLREIVDSAGVFAPLLYMVLRAGAGFVPGAAGPLQLASGVLFGFWQATLYSVIGSTAGYSISFWIARRYGRDVVVRLVGGGIGRVDALLARLDRPAGLMTARFVFYFAYDFVAYAAGLSKARYPVFLVVTFVLGIPPTALTVFTGLVGAGMVAGPR